MTRQEAARILGFERPEYNLESDVRSKFRELCFECHPDQGGSDEKFKRLSEAYGILSSLASRESAGVAYDVSEGQFQSRLIAELKKAGAIVFKVHGHAMQASGWPDLQVYSRTWTGHLELKVGDARPTQLQMSVILRLRSVGANAYVARLRDGKLTFDDMTLSWPCDGAEMLRTLSEMD